MSNQMHCQLSRMCLLYDNLARREQQQLSGSSSCGAPMPSAARKWALSSSSRTPLLKQRLMIRVSMRRGSVM